MMGLAGDLTCFLEGPEVVHHVAVPLGVAPERCSIEQRAHCRTGIEHPQQYPSLAVLWH